MTTIRHVVYTQEPGVDGNGITAIEKEQLVIDVATAKDGVDRVAPAGAGSGVEQPRITVNGPRWLPPDAVSPMLFDAAGDGSTNDYAPLMMAHDAIKATGRAGTIHLGGKKFRSNSTIVIDTPVTIEGGGMGIYTSGGGTQGDGPSGGEIQFPGGVSGLIMDKGSWGSTLRGLALTSLSAVAGSDIGFEVRAGRATFEDLYVRRFTKGIFVNGDSVGNPGFNANRITWMNVHVRLCRGDGVHLVGADANVNSFYDLDVMNCSGFGVRDEAVFRNSYYSPHFNSNAQGAMYFKTRSPILINPYIEENPDPMMRRIVIEDTTRNGYFLTPGYAAAAIYWTGPEGSETEGISLGTVASRNNLIIDDSSFEALIRLVGGANDVEWQFRLDTPGSGNLSIRGMDKNRNVLTLRSDDAMESGFSVHGKTAVAQRTLPAAASDLSSVITLSNAIRTLIIDLGFGS